MQLIQVQFLPLSQVSCSQDRIQNQDATPKDGTAEVFRTLHCAAHLNAIETTGCHVVLQKRRWETICSLSCWNTGDLRQKINGVRKREQARWSLTLQSKDKGTFRLFSQLLGNLYVFPENIQGNVKVSCKGTSAYKVSILHGYAYFPVFLIAPQLIFSRKMEANSSTSGDWSYVQPVVVRQPQDMLSGRDLTMLELQLKADPSPVPQTGQVCVSKSPQTRTLLRCAEFWAPPKHGSANWTLRLNIGLC